MLIVSPALADANNGNWHTAARWQRLLAPAVARVRVAREWHDGDDDDVLLALHARRSATSVERFAASGRALAVVLTGTDLYRDLAEGDAAAQHALECASRIVVLQQQALQRLSPAQRAKARVIVQSAPALARRTRVPHTFVAVGHLRAEKDPLALMQAAAQLPPPWCLLHIGRALDPALAEAARAAMASGGAHYRWLGERRLAVARGWIARAQALVHPSRMEGGAQVVIEAVRAGVPVLASRIDGNVGLLGDDYAGYAPPGDAAALAALMRRFIEEPALRARLAAQCAARAPLFTPEAEAAALAALVAELG